MTTKPITLNVPHERHFSFVHYVDEYGFHRIIIEGHKVCAGTGKTKWQAIRDAKRGLSKINLSSLKAALERNSV